MADELSPGSPLSPPTAPLAAASTLIGSEAFRAADAFTAKHEGGYTANDGTGHAANMGIDQNAHPELNVAALTPQQAQAIRHQYWQAMNGDALAQKDPRLALVAYDTAMASGPAHAAQLLQQSGGDAAVMMGLQTKFMQTLAQQNPEKYGPVLQGWMNRQRDLAQTIGAGVPSAPSAPAAAPETSVAEIAAAPIQAAAAAPRPEAKSFEPLTPQTAAPLTPKSIGDQYLELLKRAPAFGATTQRA